MGDWLSGVLGTNSAVDTSSQSPYAAISPYQQAQQQLMAQLQQQAAGGGPNPAQMQLQQNAQVLAQQQAQQNAQNRAINPGLAARLSGNQAANMGNTSVANAGIQQAQQQLASQQLLGSVAGQGIQGTNQASGINAGVAAGNQKAGQGIIGGLLGGAGAALGMAHGGEVPGYADGGMTMPAFGSSLSGGSAPSLGVAGVGSGAGAGGPSLGADTTFSTPSYSSLMEGQKSGGGGGAAHIDFGDPMAALNSFGKYFSNGGKVSHRNPMIEKHFDGGGLIDDIGKLAPLAMALMSKGGEVQAMVSPGEGYIPPQGVNQVMSGRNPLSVAEKIPGRAPVKGDSPKNDIVPKTLEEGGVVIPRSIMESNDPEKKAAKFVADHIRKSKKSPEGDFKEALQRAISGRKSK